MLLAIDLTWGWGEVWEKNILFAGLILGDSLLFRFLWHNFFSGCEDIILEELSPSTLLPTLEWSSLPHSSDWVYRQAMQFLQDEFTNIVQSDIYPFMPRKYLVEALKSDFLQVSLIAVVDSHKSCNH